MFTLNKKLDEISTSVDIIKSGTLYKIEYGHILIDGSSVRHFDEYGKMQSMTFKKCSIMLANGSLR